MGAAELTGQASQWLRGALASARTSLVPRPWVWLRCAALLGLAAPAAAQTGPVSPWSSGNAGTGLGGFMCRLGGAPLDGYDLLLLAAIALALALFALAAYRVALEDLIRRGMRPALLRFTILNVALGVWLLAAFALIPDVLGLCWFAVIGALFVLWLIALMATRRILLSVGIAFVLVAIGVIVVLQFVLV